MPNLVRSASLTNYAEVARAAGLDPLALLAEVGLSPACLQDPELRIPSDAARDLLEASAMASGIDTFGLRMADTRRLSNLGAVALVMREEPTVRRAVKAMMRYSHVINESLFMKLEEADGIAVLRDELLVGKKGGSSRQAMELIVGVEFRNLKFFLGPAWSPLRVCFSHPPPRDLSLHFRIFGYAVEFGQDFNGLVCTTSDLDAPNPMADPVMARYARQIIEATGADRTSTVDNVRHILLVLLPSGECSIHQVAHQLGVDRQTVHRWLVREGTSFSEVVNTTRRELAAHYLDDGRRPLSQVADLLGFSALSAFSRWYKQQFGEIAARRRRAGIAAGRVA